jgi:hypothetical protein
MTDYASSNREDHPILFSVLDLAPFPQAVHPPRRSTIQSTWPGMQRVWATTASGWLSTIT